MCENRPRKPVPQPGSLHAQRRNHQPRHRRSRILLLARNQVSVAYSMSLETTGHDEVRIRQFVGLVLDPERLHALAGGIIKVVHGLLSIAGILVNRDCPTRLRTPGLHLPVRIARYLAKCEEHRLEEIEILWQPSDAEFRSHLPRVIRFRTISSRSARATDVHGMAR